MWKEGFGLGEQTTCKCVASSFNESQNEPFSHRAPPCRACRFLFPHETRGRTSAAARGMRVRKRLGVKKF